MTTTERQQPNLRATRRPLSPEVRRAAARMVIAANKANGEKSDPRVVAVADGKA